MNPANPALRALASCTPRERQLLALASVVVLTGALVPFCGWIVTSRAQLARDLPKARDTLARMQDQAAALQQLARLPLPPDMPLATLQEVTRAAAVSHGLHVTTLVAKGGIDVGGTGNFSDVADWLASLHTGQGLRPEKASFETTPNGVRFDITLSPASAR